MKKLFPLLLLLAACGKDKTKPEDPNKSTANATFTATFTYNMDWQSFTCEQTNRYISDWLEGVFSNDTFDRVLKLGVTHSEGNSMSIEFGVPVLRNGFSFTGINTRPIVSPKNGFDYEAHMTYAYSIKKGDTLWMANNDSEHPSPTSTITYTSIQDIGDITDSIWVDKGPGTSNYAYGTFDIYKAEGTWTDSVEGLVQVPGEPDGFMQSSGIHKVVTGTFSFTFPVKQ